MKEGLFGTIYFPTAPWMVGILFSFYPCVFPPFGKLKASKDRIYDAIAVGLGNGILNKLPMLKNSFL